MSDPNCKARVWDNGDMTNCGKRLPCPTHDGNGVNEKASALDRMWRLRPEEYRVLKRAAAILRKHKLRHSGATKAVEFLDALVEAQKEANSCSPS